MTHIVLIGGTDYEVACGKTLIDNTEYDVSCGKTLIEGSEYDISFGPGLLTVTVTVSWPSGTKYVINGETIAYPDWVYGDPNIEAQTYEVEPETTITIYGYRKNRYDAGYSRVRVNGETVASRNDFSGFEILYEYTVTTNCEISFVQGNAAMSDCYITTS